ncbi:hypothetical protein ACFV7R_25900 [Streptomyces sp. NPDC059866]|uniref:hypothetical protein n=1 Tax=Streptomyces sp. NPDC059866 TaxID=3346978 RepID=UPI00364C3720
MLDAIGNRYDATSTTYDIDREGRRRQPGLGYGDLPGSPTWSSGATSRPPSTTPSSL